MKRVAIVVTNPAGEAETWEFDAQRRADGWWVFHDGDPVLASRAPSLRELKADLVGWVAALDAQEEDRLDQVEPVQGNFVEVLREGRIALTIDQLINQTSQFSKKKMVGCSANLFRTEPKFGRWTFRVRCSESYSSPSGHLTRIQLDPEFEGERVSDADIFVSCSCPAWSYWGPDYNAKSRGYLEGPQRSNGQAPDVRDPGRKNLICKHVATAGRMFKGFIFPLMYRERYRDYVEEVRQNRSPRRQPGTPNRIPDPKPETNRPSQAPQRPSQQTVRTEPIPTAKPPQEVPETAPEAPEGETSQ